MTEIPTCRPPIRDTRRARLAVPPGSVDCHTHVFVDGYPLIPDRGYNPPESNLGDMLAMHEKLGIDRVVFTQPSAYGTDNSAILDAAAQIPEQARAVVAVDGDVTDDDLEELHAGGARGIRLNLDNIGGMPVELDQVPPLAKRVAALGWHVEFLFAGHELPGLLPLLRSLDAPISIGHFGYMPAQDGVGFPPFQALLDLVREGDTWVKLSAPNRLGVGDLPPWPDVVPMARALIEANSDRMLWATDWPHPNKFGDQPNDADLLEQLELWAPDEEMRRRILVDNPTVLYGF
ncbi:MAG TPA: amidohydrolase family protein [Acidimicrobiia bacterium]|nr:amidohydrolase family protein [Acidimicrobiia bacterium]